MKIEELVTKQQLEIENLKELLRDYHKGMCRVVSVLTCIGGPLNDNINQYNRIQQDELLGILNISEDLPCRQVRKILGDDV